MSTAGRPSKSATSTSRGIVSSSEGTRRERRRDSIAAAGFGKSFNHGLGHGFGLQIHEGPFLRPGNKAVLQAGMVVTLEPGIYLAGELGVRIEDDILITPDGPEMLTHLPQAPDALPVEF